MSNTKYWCFTLNNWTEQEDAQFRTWIPANCSYGIFQQEIGENGTPHLQGYIILNERQRIQWLKNRLSRRMHLEPARGTPQENRAYCSKEGGQRLFEHGDCPEATQGRRSDLEPVVSAIKAKRPLDEVASEFPEQWVKFHKGLESLASRIDGRRDFKTEVHWYHGPTGTGKSRQAFEENPDAYLKMPTNKWWDGYDGHKTVIIDDYRRDMCTFSELLRLFDRYPHMVEIKGGSRQFLAEKIVVTTPKSPASTWEGRTDEDIAQLRRRIDRCVHFDRL